MSTNHTNRRALIARIIAEKRAQEEQDEDEFLKWNGPLALVEENYNGSICTERELGDPKELDFNEQ